MVQPTTTPIMTSKLQAIIAQLLVALGGEQQALALWSQPTTLLPEKRPSPVQPIQKEQPLPVPLVQLEQSPTPILGWHPTPMPPLA